MSMSLQDLLKKEIQTMLCGITGENGNIFKLITDEVEALIIKISLERTNYNHSRTAKILGISRGTLYRKILVFKIKNEKQLGKQGVSKKV